jgi:hypothetical protein
VALEKLPAGADGQVTLQAPTSIGIIPLDNKAFCLDAELTPDGPVPSEGAGGKMYRTWFGSNYASGRAPAQYASALHARGLFKLCAELLAAHEGLVPAKLREVLAEARRRFMRPPDGLTLPVLRDWFGKLEEGIELPRTTTVDQTRPTLIVDPPRRPFPWAWALVALLILGLAAWVAYLLYKKSKDGSAEAPQGKTPVVVLPGPAGATRAYVAVFPTPQTPPRHVKEALEKTFPGKAILYIAGEADAAAKLKKQRDLAVDELKQPKELGDLLTTLEKKKVRFKGHAAGKAGLGRVIDNGGVYAYQETAREQINGSLLRPDGLDRALEWGGLGADTQARDLLTTLRQAVADHAALKDALATVGKRRAFLVEVEPTAAALADAADRLSKYSDQLVFASRPALTLFDAVNPREPVGVRGANTLRLDVPSYWRGVGVKDRTNADLSAVSERNQVRWQKVEPGTDLTWSAWRLKLADGSQPQSSTFEVAIPHRDKVVVFRNQQLWAGKMEDELRRDMDTYVKSQLKLDVPPDDAFSTRGGEGNLTGTINYQGLAERVVEEGLAPQAADLQVLTADDFQRTMNAENAAVGG